MTALADRPTAVYRLFDADNVLLYVGITHDLKVRLPDHRCRKAWWPEVGHVSVDWCPDRSEALHQEARAVAFEKPRHNVLKLDYSKTAKRRSGRASLAGPSCSATSYLGLPVAGHIGSPTPDFFDQVRAAWGPHGLTSRRRHALPTA